MDKYKVNQGKASHSTSCVSPPSQRLVKQVQPSREQNIPSWRKGHDKTFRPWQFSNSFFPSAFF